MQTINVNGYDMAYLDVGRGPPLVCVHGSLCDFRIWSSVLGPLTRKHRVIAPSLRHFFPDHWDGGGDNTRGTLPMVLRALAANVKGSRTEMIPGTTHPMFEQAPQKYCEIVLDFLAA